MTDAPDIKEAIIVRAGARSVNKPAINTINDTIIPEKIISKIYFYF